MTLKATARRLILAVLVAFASSVAGFSRGKAARSAQGTAGSEFVTLNTPSLIFRMWPENGRYQIVDKRGGAVWNSNPYVKRFGEAILNVNGRVQRADLSRCVLRETGNGVEALFLPVSRRPDLWLRLQVISVNNGTGLEFTYSAADPAVVQSIRLLDDALWTSAADKGYLAVPVRMGLLIPADSRLGFLRDFGTYDYDGCDMEMLGVAKAGVTALVTWDDPYVTAEVRSELPRNKGFPTTQVLSSSLVMQRSAHSFWLLFPGRGDYVSIGQAYRQIATERGWRVPWQQKVAVNPQRCNLFGAIDFKLWNTLERRMESDSTRQESVQVNWTFQEAAQVAEHLKNDLKLEKVLFTLGGWIRRGYDNQHPDIMPAAPECGGSAWLASCARRIRQLGYLFCLHDNYQDIYRDSPSWNEGLILKRPDGGLAEGGRWAGGQAYLICSQEGIKLARRPQNLPAVKALTGANAYFIDTIFAAGLHECYDRVHPLTRPGDMKWKQALADYARNMFGIFGSEDGREWAIPHADFFEGLTAVSGTWFHNQKLLAETGGVAIPLFEIVYRDCIALYGKYGFDIFGSADYVLYHMTIGRTLNYHAIPPHLYWKQWAGSGAEAQPVAWDGPGIFTRAEQGWAEGMHPLDRFLKNTYEVLSPLNELTSNMELRVHEFLSPDRKIQRTLFGSGPDEVQVIVNAGQSYFRYQTRRWGIVLLPPKGFFIESPSFVAFHAVMWNSLTYAPDSAPLFTLASLDHNPLTRSTSIRVYHGFGDTRLKLRGVICRVQREAVLSQKQ